MDMSTSSKPVAETHKRDDGQLFVVFGFEGDWYWVDFKRDAVTNGPWQSEDDAYLNAMRA
jgi:hypothetical protein